jgi:hypothetical protein
MTSTEPSDTPERPTLPPLPPKWTGLFRKRPVVVEAVQLTRENVVDVMRWVAPAVKVGQAVDVTIDIDKGLTVSTLEGDMRADYGWWVIKGVAGEFYPCDPAIFEATYEPAANRPRIVCLCGSTRFYAEFQQANYDLTMRGEIVLSVGFYPHAKAEHGHGEGVGHDSAEKVALDELHKRKIDLADYVLVLNVGGYIGDSTRSEVAYAYAHGKPVRYLVQPPDLADPAEAGQPS